MVVLKHKCGKIKIDKVGNTIKIKKFFVLLHECFLVHKDSFSLRAFMTLLNGHVPLILAHTHA